MEAKEKEVTAKKKDDINLNFVKENEQIRAENEERKIIEKKMKKVDRYDYFPFISGETIEKHRAVLGSQLKNEMQSYFDHVR